VKVVAAMLVMLAPMLLAAGPSVTKVADTIVDAKVTPPTAARFSRMR
jgi:hypothetical protein